MILEGGVDCSLDKSYKSVETLLRHKIYG